MKRPFVLSALIPVLAIAFSFAVAAQERLEHPGAGIGIDRPAGWHDATLAQVQANRERVRLSDPELQKALATRSAMPLFVFTKYAEPYAGVNPSIQVTLRSGLAGTPTQLLAAALEPMRRGFFDFRIMTPVQSAPVGGWPGAHVRVAYTLKNDAGESFRVLSRLWLVPRGHLMFLIGMSGGDTGVDVAEDAFAAAFSSIVIQK